MLRTSTATAAAISMSSTGVTGRSAISKCCAPQGQTSTTSYDTLPGWDSMKANDQFYAADFNGDGRGDLYVFNGRDWSVGYLEMLRSTGTDLNYVVRYDRQLPGWDDMKSNDTFLVGDFNRDKR